MQNSLTSGAVSQKRKFVFLSLPIVFLFALGFIAVFPLQSAYAQNSTTLQVISGSTDSHALSGYYIVLYQNGKVIATGFTEATFSLVSGQTYAIRGDSYGNCIFSYWDIPVTGGYVQNYNDPMTFTASSSSSMQLIATYNCQTSNTPSLTISTQNTEGNVITGYYTVLNQSSSIVATGFTPAPFTLNSGQTYTVQVDNYGSCQFDHWADTGSKVDVRTVSISSNAAYTAVMNCGGSSALTISSQNTNGQQINGYDMVLYQNYNVVSSEFTPTQYSLNVGATYTVAADNYGSCTFYEWVNATNGIGAIGGSITTFTANSHSQSFIAVYSCA